MHPLLFLQLVVWMALQDGVVSQHFVPASVNLTNILQQYVSVCGLIGLCHPRTFEAPVHIPGCDYCTCAKDCHVHGTCCPDVLLQSCVDTGIGQTKGSYSYFMMNTCQDDSPEGPVHQCRKSGKVGKELFGNAPLYSPSTQMNFKAECCHLINDSVSWNLETKCPKQHPFNTYSSIEDLYNAFQKQNCDVWYEPILGVKCYPQELIRNCNVTGEWDVYDSDIEWACLHSYAPYSIYSSVFCYLCNTPLFPPLVLKEGISFESDDEVTALLPKNSSCQVNFASNGRAFPYSNFYCLAEVANVMGNNPKRFLDAGEVRITENYQEYEKYPFKTDIAFSIQDYNILEVWNSSYPLDMSDAWFYTLTKPDMTPVNISSLYETYITNGGVMDWCSNNFTQNQSAQYSHRVCDCDLSCITTGSCCPDYALTVSHFTNCISIQILRDRSEKDETYYTVISKCPVGCNDTFLKTQCENEKNIQSVYDIFPVWDDITQVSYKNIHCLRCHKIWRTENNKASTTNHDWAGVALWDLSIRCKKHILFNRFPSLRLLIQSAITSECVLDIHPQYNLDAKCLHQGMMLSTSVCNLTGDWLTYENDVMNMCEAFYPPGLIYSNNTLLGNIFCEICNSGYGNNSYIEECNVTGQWFKYIDSLSESCLRDPFTPEALPYKNFACMLCNNVFKQSHPDQAGGRTSYRTLFSAHNFNTPTNHGSDSSTCDDGTTYDSHTGVCRKIHCAKGKTLVGDECLPLLTETSDLSYIVYVKLKASVIITEDSSTLNVFKMIMQTFSSLIRNVSADIYIRHMYALSNLHCEHHEYAYHDTTLDTRGSLFLRSEIKIYRAQHIDYLTEENGDVRTNVKSFPLVMLNYVVLNTRPGIIVNRQSLETALLNVTNGIFNIRIGNATTSLNVSRDIRAFDLPVHIRTPDTMPYCKLIMNSLPEDYNRVNYLLNNLLICKQIMLTESEYELNNDKSLRLTITDRTFEPDQYSLEMDGTVRICIDDYNSSPQQTDMIDLVLSVFTLVCTCVSLLAVLVTFGIYCWIPSLRTLPGKNIMSLTACLFLAQLSFLIKSTATGTTFCRVIGLVIHYTWLATFCWMNVGSFHMFYVFSRHQLVHSSKSLEKKIFRKYLLYAFVTPAVVILLHVISRLSITGGQHLGYGGDNCFMIDTTGWFVAFLLPVLIICLSNIVFFTITMLRIKNSPRVASTQVERRDITIYIKLFSITGITWILQIVDGEFPTSPFSFLVTLFNGLQGLFIFLSYGCNSRVRGHFRSEKQKETSVSATGNKMLSRSVTESTSL